MAHRGVPGASFAATIVLFGLGMIGGAALAQPASPAAGTPDPEPMGVVARQAASPVSATPVAGRGGDDAIVRDAVATAIEYGTPTDGVEPPGPVNVFVEVNTFLVIGDVSMDNHGIRVEETGACEDGGDEPEVPLEDDAVGARS